MEAKHCLEKILGPNENGPVKYAGQADWSIVTMSEGQAVRRRLEVVRALGELGARRLYLSNWGSRAVRQ
jgi:hypothetical protein